MLVATFIFGYVAIGYVLGVPLAALLDYALGIKGQKLSVAGAVAIWPIVIGVALLALPLLVRGYLHGKINESPDSQSGLPGA